MEQPGKAPGSSELAQPPAIEHITQNYVPLKTLILSISERCGKELANVLRTNENLPNDAARKDQFLRFVVACRQEYVKLYVLCKWAVVSGEISKAIDVANWLHGQINCFNNVVGALYHLQAGLGPAKSPWADIETALQVLKYGGPLPTPEAKQHIPTPPLENSEVVSVLRRLDILIALRLALHEHLPGHFGNYEVKNGRARFQLGNDTLWVELSIADEQVATQCRFFFVDCGLNSQDTLAPAFKHKIEAAVNEQLATRSLVAVLDWLSMFTAVYKLQLLDRQLSLLETGAGPWSGVVSHRYTPTSLTIFYFLESTDRGQVRITVSNKAPRSLVADPALELDLDGPIDDLAVTILSKATKAHASRLIDSIKAPFITPVSGYRLSIELAPSKFTELTIDTTSGKYSLSGTGPLMVSAQANLNKGRDPVEVLTKLHDQMFMDTVASRAEASGWRTLPNVRLAPDESSKIAPHTSLLALRLSYTTGWSLCVAMGGDNSSNLKANNLRWFASRLDCSQRRWILGPIHEFHNNALNLDDPNYKTFLELKTIFVKQFVLYELMRELTLSGIRHELKQKNGQTVGVVADITTVLDGSSNWAYSGLLFTVEGQQIRVEGRARSHSLLPLGSISEVIHNCQIEIDGRVGKFVLTTAQVPDRSSQNTRGVLKPEKFEPEEEGSELKNLTQALRVLHNAAKSLASAASLGLEVQGATLTSLEIKYAEPRGVLSVQNGHTITFADSNPQKPLTSFLPAVGEHSNSSFGKIVTFLKEWYSVWELLAELRSSDADLQVVVLPQAMNWIRIRTGLEVERAYLDVCLRDFRHQCVVNHVAAGNGAENIAGVSRWFNETLTDGVVPLVTGCAIALGSENVLKELVLALASGV